MTMLTIVQNFCRRTGIPRPATVYGSSDAQVLQVMSLLEEEGNDLALRHDWEGLTQEAAITTLAAEDQGALITLASNGFRRIKNESFWNRTDNLPVCGPVDAADWQAIKGMPATGARYQYRVRGGKLLLTPVPTAGLSMYFEYISKNWILGADTVTYKQYFTLDTDTVLLPEELMLMGLRWRWKKEKGFDYAEDFATYESQVRDATANDGGRKRLRMDDNTERLNGPAVFISAGSWAVP